MAERPVYIITDDLLVKKIDIEFEWIKGIHKSRKLLCVKSLQETASEKHNIDIEKFIEISTCSDIELGKNLSAFNLETKSIKSNKTYSVESAFQSSKVFEKGGPYKDLLYKDSKEAKKDPRIKESGNLLHFDFFGKKFEADGKSLFYDWLYINILLKEEEKFKDILKYRAFTDIEFNPKKMINTQAFSITLYVALKLNNIDMSNFRDEKVFKEKTKDFYIDKDSLFN